MKPKGRIVRRLLFGMLTVVLLFVAVPTAAQANATRCSNATCIDVRGNGLWVDTVDVSVNVVARAIYVGHWETWGSGFHYNTSDQTFNNLGSNVGWRSWTARYNLQRGLPNQSQICTQFWRKNIPYQSYSSLGTACITVHS